MTIEPPEPRTDGQQPTVERGGLWGLFFAAAGLLLPPFGVVLSVLGIFQGHRARKAAKQAKGVAPGALLSQVLGWIGVAVSILALIGYAVFWQEYTEYRACTARAHTESSQQACDLALREGIAERAGVPVESVPQITAGG
ncbi:DUF4190 domain-containing protein [Nocardiopsis sediminis]|uniref:DUF4190 domain-containing protein n=1 Tax=Nocardiopsis sediminis TaxID=1778267 RepID=A0ABV8FLH6_9ACTN